MMILMSEALLAVYLDWSSLMQVRPICAYIDPGTGSLVLQIIIAGLCGGLFVVKIFWNQIKTFFKNLFSKGNKAQEK